MFNYKFGILLLVGSLILNFLAIALAYNFQYLFNGIKNKIDIQYELYLLLTGHKDHLPEMSSLKKSLVVISFFVSYLGFCLSLIVLTHHTIKKHF